MKLKDIKGLLPDRHHCLSSFGDMSYSTGRDDTLLEIGKQEVEIDIGKLEEIIGDHWEWREECKNEIAHAIAKECPIKVVNEKA